MKKRLNAKKFLLVVAIMATTSTSVFAAGNNYMKVDGVITILDNAPVIENGTTLIGIDDLAKILGATIDKKDTSSVITITKGSEKVNLAVGSNLATAKGKTTSLSVAPKVVNDKVVVPLKVVSELLGAKVAWDGTAKISEITTGQDNSSVLVLEKSNYGKSLNYDEAFNKALEINSSMQTLQANLDLLEKQRENVMQTVIATMPADPTMPFVTDAANLSALSATNSIDTQLAGKNYNQEIIRGGIEAAIRGSFTNIKNYEVDMSLLKQSIATSKQNLDNLKLKLDLGLESKYNVDKATLDYEQILKNLDLLKLAINGEYIGLNNLLGFKADERYNVDYDVKFSNVKAMDIDAFASRLISSDPTIKLKELAIKDAEFGVNAYSYTGTGDSYDSKVNKVDQATRNLSDAKLSMDKSLRSTYNQIKQLEEQNKNVNIDLQKAREDYNTVLIQFKAGLTTAYNVELTKLAIAKNEAAIQKNINQHEQLVFLFNHPFLLSSK